MLGFDGQHDQAIDLSARHHRHFDRSGVADMMHAAQGARSGIVDVRLAALERPAIARQQRFARIEAFRGVPALGQIQAIARIVEDVEGAGELG
ncbi:MAG: hypothetical protein EOO76_15685 [Novosphingobium sp.]|nr:MAG: hypothetical protein EOO76_15685 [Novosphingobium sp.]